MTRAENINKMNSKKTEDYTLLKNGLIVDGTGKQGYRGNLLIKGKKIEEVSEKPISIDCETIDCSGLVIAPGLSMFTLIWTGFFLSKVMSV